MCDDRDEFLLSAGSVIQTYNILVLKISMRVHFWENLRNHYDNTMTYDYDSHLKTSFC